MEAITMLFIGILAALGAVQALRALIGFIENIVTALLKFVAVGVVVTIVIVGGKLLLG